MKIPDMNEKNTRAFLDKVRERASSYTPEWRMDLENPDGGTALALLFAGMYEDTLKKYAQLPRKSMLDFFNCVGTALAPARPAGGYAVFGLVNQEADGTEIRRGTGLLARPEEDQEEIIFETRNDVYVTPSRICDMVQVIPEKDGIYRIHREEDQKVPGNFPLFEEYGENVQEHTLYLAHNHVFYVKRSGSIRLTFRKSRNREPDAAVLRALADPESASVEYSAGERFEPFAKVEAEPETGELILHKGEDQPVTEKCELDGTYAFWIRIRCRNVSLLSELEFADIRVTSQTERSVPDVTLAGGIEQRGEYLPFGEQMGLYEEVYFSSEQALSQKNAQITLSFRMNFLRIPSETYGQDRKRDWKLIMKRTDFIPDPEYDIGIDEVIWEYYNGNDWRKLPESDRYSKVFRAASDQLERKTEITFNCPGDLTPVLVGAVEGRYIRARILKMNNLYRWNGQYITPVLRDTGFEYRYHEPFPMPELIERLNNMRSDRIYPEDLFRAGKDLKPFVPLEEESETLYIGFDQPLRQWPIRIFFKLRSGSQNGNLLRYEYYNGKTWKALNMIDGTEGFGRIGIVTLLGNSDFMPGILWEKERFWIRIRKTGDERNTEASQRTMIQEIWMNATEITAEETMDQEVFSIEANEKNAVFRLAAGNITKAEVWVQEHREYSEEQLAKLRQAYEIRTEKTEDGTVRHVWIRWEERENFASSTETDCHYMLDKNEGILQFSDGIHGRIPDDCGEASIRVRYRCGGGKRGNVPAGAVNRFRETTGFVNQVINPMDMSGGVDREKVETAIQRQGRAFRHRGRAVTAGDYEALAMESSGSILKAKCFPGQGRVNLVLLLREHNRELENFDLVKRECLQYMEDKIPASLLENRKFRILEPQFIHMAVKAEIRVRDMNQILETRQRILKALHLFLDPMEGNFQGNGWEIGVVPNQIQILNELRGVQGVEIVTSLRLVLQTEQNGRLVELDAEELEKFPYAVAVEGEHQIDITTGGGAD